MMRRIFYVFFAVFFAVGSVCGETVKSLRNKQRQAKRNIEMTNKLLKENQKSQKNTVNNLTVLKKQIEERQKLIKALNDEVGVLDQNLGTITEEKRLLEERLKSLKDEYADLLYHYYFHKSKSSGVLYVLSSESLTQGMRRMRYVQEYSRYRKQQAIEIEEVTKQLQTKQDMLAAVKQEKSNAMKGKQIENSRLEKARADKQQMLSELTKKEQDLRLKLKKEQERENVLSKKIDEMVAQEIAAAERRAKAKEEARRKALEAKRKQQQNNAKPSASNGTSPQTKPTQPTVSKETTVVSGGFEANKGRLPWPCKGVMTGHFGLHPHPVLDHVQVNNKGVYIQTAAGSDACAVYDGEVTQVFAIPGNNNAVIVKHGTYRTVYANVTTTYVTAGAKVKKGQKLGRVFVDHENGNKAEVYFMVYKGSTLQNPEIWLVR